MEESKIQLLKHWLGTGSINVFGRPFSGKDTQSKFLANIFAAPIIGGGDIIRNSKDEALKKTIDGGILAPQQAYLDMVLPYFSQEQFSGKPLILSSVGRWSGEETSVVEALRTSSHDLKAVLYLDLPEADVLTRWEAAQTIGDRGSRADDARDVVDVRLEEFKNKTLPVIEYYRQLGLLIEIDGSRPPDSVTQEILEALLSRASL